MIKFKESIIKDSTVSVGKVNPNRQASVIPRQHSVLMSVRGWDGSYGEESWRRRGIFAFSTQAFGSSKSIQSNAIVCKCTLFKFELLNNYALSIIST